MESQFQVTGARERSFNHQWGGIKKPSAPKISDEEAWSGTGGSGEGKTCTAGDQGYIPCPEFSASAISLQLSAEGHSSDKRPVHGPRVRDQN